MSFLRDMPNLTYVLYTRCSHSEQVFPYSMEPTFIQTYRSSLESQVLDFTYANKDQVYQI